MPAGLSVPKSSIMIRGFMECVRLNKTALGACWAVCIFLNFARVQGIEIASDGSGRATIVTVTGTAYPERHAARELADFLKQVAGVNIPIVKTGEVKSNRILIGEKSARLADPTFTVEGLGSEGLVMRTVGNDLILAGGRNRGTLYAVYTFLEDHLGCRWYSSKVSRIPRRRTIAVGPINDTQVPAFEYREVYYHDAMDPDFAARQKLNGNASIISNGRLVSERHLGWGLWCHSFFALVPPKTYFMSLNRKMWTP